MSHSNISGFSSLMHSHLVVWYAFPSKKSFWTSILIPKHDSMSSGVLYPFNASNCSLRFMRHTVTINISQLCVNKWSSQVASSAGIMIEYVDTMMWWYYDMVGLMIWWFIKLKTKSDFFARKMLLCDIHIF